MARSDEYYGNGQRKDKDDEKNYNRGYSPTFSSNPFHSVNFDRLNAHTYYAHNGIYKNY